MRKRLHLLAGLTILAGTLFGLDFGVGAQSSPGVVISEFRVRGPNGGADEFVELYNASSSPVNIGGWLIRGSNNAASVSTRVTIATGVVLNPGCYYLVTNSSTSGGPYSGGVPGDQTYATGIADDGGIALVNGTTIVDQVGMSAGSAFKEGTPLANLGSSNQNRGYERRPGGVFGNYVDTNNNQADFQLIAPSNPQNRFSACIPANAFAIAATAPASAVQFEPFTLTATVANPPGVPAVIADLSAFGLPAPVPLFDDGAAPDVAAGDNVYSAEVIPPVQGTFVGHVTAATPSLNVTASFTTTVVAPPTIYAPYEIQGSGTFSPLNGQTLIVEGVVTARKFNGFFIQSPADEGDGDPQTSDGLFVFTSSAPTAAAQVGRRVRVTGRVVEFVPSGDPGSPPLTELTSVTLVQDRGAAPLPAPVDLSLVVSAAGAFDDLEPYEGMLVYAPSLTATSGTLGNISEANATATSNGVFTAVLTGTPRPRREAGIEASRPVPTCFAGPPCSVPVFDANPEVLRVDSDALEGIPPADVSAGAVIANVVGPLDYGFRRYTILPLAPLAPVGGAMATTVSGANAAQFAVASFNVQRFFDTINDPAIGEPVLTAAALDRRLTKISLAIREHLGRPDIIGLQEVENIGTLQAIADRVNADAGTPGDYVAYLEEGNDVGGIDVGFLVRSSRVQVSSVTQYGLTTTFINPVNGQPETLNDRPPLVLRATLEGPPERMPASIAVVVSHLRSLNDIDSPRTRAKRLGQAEFLAQLLLDLQLEGAPVVAVGDYNAFEVNDGHVDVLGILLGVQAPPTEVAAWSTLDLDPAMTRAASAADDYSYVFDGSIQNLDHVLMDARAVDLYAGLEHARISADFAETSRNDGTSAVRLSDHDPAVAYFHFPQDVTAPVIGSLAPNRTELWPPNHQMVPVTLSVTATDNRSAVTCEVTNVASSEPDNGTGDGDTGGDALIVGPLRVDLRAERAGTGNGRTYTITVACRDLAGNASSADAIVVVPKNRKK
ncbi:MAG: lamin tail domain-containing protein [Acidobacteriota bacterium]